MARHVPTIPYGKLGDVRGATPLHPYKSFLENDTVYTYIPLENNYANLEVSEFILVRIIRINWIGIVTRNCWVT